MKRVSMEAFARHVILSREGGEGSRDFPERVHRREVPRSTQQDDSYNARLQHACSTITPINR